MAMLVAHNSSSALALGELNKKHDKLAKDLKKVSSGVKITGVSDDVSGYAISEKMRVQIRGLSQDIQNVQNGKSLLNVASGGVQDIVDELRYLKELAINSANDHNSGIDRATLQKEFDQRRTHIEDVAVETNYNGIILLDGRWGRSSWGWGQGKSTEISRSTTSSITTSPSTITNVGPNTSTRIIPPTTSVTTSTSTITLANPPAYTGITTTGPVISSNTTSASTITGPYSTSSTSSTMSDSQETKSGKFTTVTDMDIVTTKNVTSTTTTQTDTTTTHKVTTTTIVSATPVTTVTPASPIIITNGTTAITKNGIYEFAPDYTGTLTISATNVEIMGPSSGGTLNDVYLVDSGLNDLYLKNVNIVNTQDKSAITFDEVTSSTLHLLGSNSIYDFYNTLAPKITATINAGGGISFVGNGNLSITHGGYPQGAMIGSDFDGICGNIAIGQQVKITATSHSGAANGAGIGSGGGVGRCGDISIGTDASVSILYDNSSTGRNGQCATAIGTGSRTSVGESPQCGDIIIYSGANVSAHSIAGAGIGSGNPAGICGDIKIFSNSTVTASSHMSPGIGAGWSGTGYTSKCGDITIYSYTSGNVNSTAYNDGIISSSAENIGSGIPSSTSLSIVGSVNLLSVTNNNVGGIADFSEPSLGTTTITSYDVKTDTITNTETSQLIVETKTIQYETTTETTETVTTIVYEDGEPEWIEYLHDPLIIHTGTKANQHLRVYIKDMRLGALGIESTKIDPREEAVNSLDVIDKAIEYALDTATKIGAYVMELNFTEGNLVMADENTQSSESAIRDADMAKEMTNFVKDSVLAQAAKFMLAQANQNSNSVLKLLN